MVILNFKEQIGGPVFDGILVNNPSFIATGANPAEVGTNLFKGILYLFTPSESVLLLRFGHPICVRILHKGVVVLFLFVGLV